MVSNAGTSEHPQKKGSVPKSLGTVSNASALAFSEETVPESTRTNGAAHKTQVLKVDQAKLDTLMNLIGELVVSKNSLPFLARRAEEIYGSREMSREIKEQYGVIDRLAQEMQTAIMTVRMQPISEAFDRFPRLVRDLARNCPRKSTCGWRARKPQRIKRSSPRWESLCCISCAIASITASKRLRSASPLANPVKRKSC